MTDEDFQTRSEMYQARCQAIDAYKKRANTLDVIIWLLTGVTFFILLAYFWSGLTAKTLVMIVLGTIISKLFDNGIVWLVHTRPMMAELNEKFPLPPPRAQ